jgi:hypothetical protein
MFQSLVWKKKRHHTILNHPPDVQQHAVNAMTPNDAFFVF